MSREANSSMNRLTHGCRSTKTVLPSEDPAEYEFVLQCWLELYDPQTPEVATLVDETAHAHWFLKRCAKRLAETEWALPADATAWTPEHHKQFQNFSRYKTTAERAFLRFYKELEGCQHRSERAALTKQQALAKATALELKWLEKHQKGNAAKTRMVQVVEVEVLDGKTYTSYYPTNQELIEDAARHRIDPVSISRLIVFPDGIVPAEYAWATTTHCQHNLCPKATQKMLWSRWLEVIEREKASGTGHIGPLFPRP